MYVVLRHPSSSSLATLHCVLGDDVKKSDRGESEMRTDGAEERKKRKSKDKRRKMFFVSLQEDLESLCGERWLWGVIGIARGDEMLKPEN